MDFFQLSYWHWWMLAIALLILEFLAIGTVGSFFLWPAIAAVAIGFLTLLFPMLTVEYQILILALVSVVSVVIGRAYLGKHPLSSDEPYLNLRGAELVGRTFPVSEAIVNGMGRIRVDDGSWRVEGPDCPVGTPVKVVGAGSVRLKVKPVV
ncbi:hypothetical protein PN36_18435 [Candidatus Thiomargarita nelsonii]|uniref:NfeD-like C-terminal domain-containing protein n=1 Tax=Candidatus Thiomargarita nelsonii TaxID=1003181 RepID=A0A0A6RMG7_9GAMM|nr:hypothetical protein PN36_18435 [Candidatus Thiomargarita nelsonii]